MLLSREKLEYVEADDDAEDDDVDDLDEVASGMDALGGLVHSKRDSGLAGP